MPETKVFQEPLELKHLMNCFDGAIVEKANYIGIAVTVPGAEGLEVIINPSENFTNKKEYYDRTYNEDLTHKTAPLKIVGFTYGNRYDDIEVDLVSGFAAE